MATSTYSSRTHRSHPVGRDGGLLPFAVTVRGICLPTSLKLYRRPLVHLNGTGLPSAGLHVNRRSSFRLKISRDFHRYITSLPARAVRFQNKSCPLATALIISSLFRERDAATSIHFHPLPSTPPCKDSEERGRLRDDGSGHCVGSQGRGAERRLHQTPPDRISIMAANSPLPDGAARSDTAAAASSRSAVHRDTN
ncbi:hypothetical protein INR49_010093 [Caranx melampygus]|nr:hypothetical protein INR49_010093 [Caranx melampygus]